MSSEQSEPARSTRRRGRIHPRLIISCALIWVLLWGDLSIANLLAGALLGFLITVVFPLPPITLRGRLRPLGLLRLSARLIVDLVRSSLAVLFVAVRFGYTPRNAVIKVQLRSRTDLYLTQTAELVSLVPGSLVLEARRSTSTLYLHVMDVRSRDDLDQARRNVLDAERRVIETLGTRAEIAALRSGRPQPEPGPEGER